MQEDYHFVSELSILFVIRVCAYITYILATMDLLNQLAKLDKLAAKQH